MKVVVHPSYKITGKLTSNKTAYEYKNRSVTLTGNITEGYGECQYRFREAYGRSTKVVQAYGSSKKYSFRTQNVDRHIYYLDVKDKEGQVVAFSYTLNVVAH